MSDVTRKETSKTRKKPDISELEMEGSMTRERLIDHLEHDSKVLNDPPLKAAFQAIDRKDFVGTDYDFEAYEDYQLPTLEGQTMLQPTTMAFMLELLNPQKGQTILNIGSGSGWSSALLGHMAGAEGKVVGLEIIPSLVDASKKNLKKYKDLPISISQATKDAGAFKEGPYDRILSTAAFEAKDDQAVLELLLQLIRGGNMVVPIADTIVKFEKVDDDNYYETEYPGFSFSNYI